MAGNPLIDQGVLNRLIGSVIINDAPSLNVTAPYLGKEGIRLNLEGDAVVYLPTMTGAVRSPEPYMMVSLRVSLLKTQNLADLWKRRQELDSFLGVIVVRPDATTLSPYTLLNCSIANVGELNFSGTDPGYGPTVKGYYPVNTSLYAQG
jgi:hypothetical protein